MRRKGTSFVALVALLASAFTYLDIPTSANAAIVSSNLVLNLDASSTSSLAATGATGWNSVSPASSTATSSFFGNAARVTDSTGASMSMDGTGDATVFPAGTARTAGAMTVDTWIKPGNLRIGWNVFASRWFPTTARGGTSVDQDWHLGIYGTTSSNLKFQLNTGAGLITSTTTFPTTSANKWYHLAVTIDAANTATLWVNGVAETTQANFPHTDNATAQLHIGDVGDAAQSSAFNGNISRVRIYNAALTPAQMAQNFLTDSVNYGYAPANTVAPSVTGTAKVGTALSATEGTWGVGDAAGTTTTYQWQSSTDGSTGWANITGATSATYTPVTNDALNFLRVNVTKTNSGGSATASSAATVKVQTQNGISMVSSGKLTGLIATVPNDATIYNVTLSTSNLSATMTLGTTTGLTVVPGYASTASYMASAINSAAPIITFRGAGTAINTALANVSYTSATKQVDLIKLYYATAGATDTDTKNYIPIYDNGQLTFHYYAYKNHAAAKNRADMDTSLVGLTTTDNVQAPGPWYLVTPRYQIEWTRTSAIIGSNTNVWMGATSANGSTDWYWPANTDGYPSATKFAANGVGSSNIFNGTSTALPYCASEPNGGSTGDRSGFFYICGGNLGWDDVPVTTTTANFVMETYGTAPFNTGAAGSLAMTNSIVATSFDAPTGVTATATGAGSAFVSWTAPAANTTINPLNSHKVEYSTSAAFTTFSTAIVSGASYSSTVISGLTANTLYYFRVFAYGATGGQPYGVTSAAVSTTTLSTATTITVVSTGGGVAGTDYTISKGTIFPKSGTSANVNASDIQTSLGSITTLLAADNVVISAPITWSSGSYLQLGNGSSSSVTINKTITTSGSFSQLIIPPTTYTLDVKNGASIQFTSALSQYLTIGGTSYTLLKTEAQIAALASTTGNYALAKPLTFATAYTSSSPISVLNFAGTIDGLGNTINGLSLNPTTAGGNGFIRNIATGAVVRNLGVINVDIKLSSANALEVGALVGNSNGGTLEQVWTTGSIKATPGATVGNLLAGGILGDAISGTTTITKSWSSVSIDTSTATFNYLAQGGIVGGAVASYGQANTGNGGNVTLDQVYSIGNQKWTTTAQTWHAVGGILGIHFSKAAISFTDVFSWSNLSHDVDANNYNYGGIIGVSQTGTGGTASTFTRMYTNYDTCSDSGSNAVSACTKSVVPGSAVSAMTGSNWTTNATYGTYLTNVAPPVKPLFVQVIAPADNSYSGIANRFLDSNGTAQSLSALNLSVTGTPVYSILANAAKATYPSVTYTSGLALGGTAAAAYSVNSWAAGTSVTISRVPQTFTWSPTTSISFGSGTFTPSAAPVSSAGSTISYAVASAGTTGCTVNPSTGAVTYTAAGSCAVTATAAQTADYTSATATVTFSIAEAAAAPTVTTIGTSTTSLLVSWTVPTVNSSVALTGYQILYSTSADMSGATTVNTGNTNTTRLFTGLASGTTYYFQVRAVGGSTWLGAVNATAVTGTPKVANTTITVVATGGGVLGTDYKLSNGVLYTTSAIASVNVADIQTALQSGDLTIAADNIVVNTAITWSSNQTLTLGTTAVGSLDLNDSITASGAGAGLVIAATNYNLKTQTGAEIILSGASSTLSIGGNSYTLIRAVGDLASVTTTGFYALAKPIAYSGNIATSPINLTFTGTFDGLGNNVDLMRIRPVADGSYGFFSYLNGATVRNLGITRAWTSITTAVNLTKISSGIVAGETSGTTSLTQVWTTGHNDATMGTISRYGSGGLIGNATSGTLTITKSWSAVSMNSNGAAITYIAIGGLLGSTSAVVGDASTIAGGSVVMNQVYSTGNIYWQVGPGHRGYGGLIGLPYSTGTVSITDAFSWSPMRNADNNYAGLLGAPGGGAITVTRAYTTNTTSTWTGGTQTLTSVSAGITLGANVANLNTANWSASGTSKLVNLPDPFRPAYVAVVAPTDGSYSTLSYMLVDGLWTSTTLASLNVTATGTPTYTIAPNVTNGIYSVDYVSGLTLTGSNAPYYQLMVWPISTSVTISKQNQTVSWTPTTSVNFGSGSFTPSSAPVASGGTTISYALSSAGTTGCTVNPTTGVVTYTSAGSCSITATAAGTSSYLSASTTVSFTIAEAAAAPTVTPTAATTNSIMLTWTAPTVNASTSLTGYQITYSTAVGMTSPTTITTTNANTSRLITGLTTGTTYYFQVRAINGSTWSGTANATPASAAPKASATTITVVASGGGVSGTDFKIVDGVFYTTSSSVSVNAADIQNELLTKSVVIAAENVVVNKGITWATSQSLTLGNASTGSLVINDSITASGATAGLVIAPTTYTLNVSNGSEIILSGSSSTLSIGGTNYTLIRSIAGLSTVGATGNYALSQPLAFSSTALTAAPITSGFTGTFDGLGNTLDGMILTVPSTGMGGLFGSLTNGATVRNLGVTNVKMTMANSASSYVAAGVITANVPSSTTGTVTLNRVWSTGFITGASGTIQHLAAGGLVAWAQAGTVNISQSWSSVNIDVSSVATTNLAVGGLLGTDVTAMGQGWGSGGANFSITESYSTGNIKVGTFGWVGIGGLVGLHWSSSTTSISDSFHWGLLPTGTGNTGGILGASGSVSTSLARTYTTSTCINGAASIGCTSGQTIGATVSGLNTSVWSSSGASTLVNLALPTRPLYVQVLTNTNGTYDTVSYQIVDGSGAVQNAAALTALGLSVSGTAAYTPSLANAPISASPYSFNYSSGLTLGGSNASLYSLLPWRDATSVTISKLNQTMTWSPTTSLAFGTGTVTPTAPTSTGGSTMTYAVTSAGTTGCTVNASTGVLTYTSGGSCTVSATTPSTGNYLQVSASATFVIADPATAPTASATTAGSGMLNIGWTVPSVSASAAITGYTLTYSTAAAMTGATTVNVGNTRGYLLTGLTAGTTYYFQVRAVSGSTWTGPLSDVASATPNSTATTINVVASGGGVAGTDYKVNGGVISATGTVNINDTDIEGILATEGTVQLAATNVNVNASISWSSNAVLVLGNTSAATVNVNDVIAGSGATAGVKILPTTYGLAVKSGSAIRLTGSTPSFNLGGTSYTVVNTVAGLSNVAAGTTWALTAPITLSTNYSTAVRDFTFTGIMDGLGNTVNNMQITPTTTRDVGFFAQLGGATVRNVGFTNINFYSNTGSINLRMGAVAGNGSSTGTNTVTQVWATGFNIQDAASGAVEIGGLFGGATAGTLNISKSWSSVSIASKAPSVGSGGLIGTNANVFSQTAVPTSAYNTLTINESYSVGNILRDLPANLSWYGNGGIIGVAYGWSVTINNSFTWGVVNATGTNGNSYVSTGGVVGIAHGSSTLSISNVYTTSGTNPNCVNNAAYTGCTSGAVAGAPVTGFSTGLWSTVNGASLVNLAPPTKLLYVRVKAPTDGSFGTVGYEIVDSTGTLQTLSSLNLSVSGTPTYDTISSASAKGTYTVNYSSGLTLGGTSAGVYSLNAWKTATSVVLSRLPQTLTWAPTTAIAFKTGSFTPSSTPSAVGAPTITYTVSDQGTTSCSVASLTGVVTYSSAGTCVVTATAAQTTDYTAASVNVSFVIAAAPTFTVVTSGGGVSGTDYTVSGGVITATSNASINASDLVTLLGTGSVQLAGNVIVNAPITWSANTVLTLGGTSGNNVTINKKITASGNTAGLEVKPSTYSLDTKNGISIVLSGTTPTLSIGGSSYTLVKSIADLANVTAVSTDKFALAVPVSFSTAITASPINVNFAGTFDGLGNTVDNMKLTYTGATNVGFFKNLAGGTIRNLGIINQIVSLEPATTTGNLAAGGLVGDSTGGTIEGVWTTGFVKVKSGKTYASLGMGGIVGNVSSGTLTINKTWSSVGLDGWYGTYTAMFAGGLVGGDLGTWSATSATAGGSLVMNEVYSTGDVSTPLTSGTNGIGGLIGLHQGTGTITVTNAFTWTQLVGNTGVNFGGFLGFGSGGAATFTNGYSINSVNYPAGSSNVTSSNTSWNYAMGATPGFVITGNSSWYESTNGRALSSLPMAVKNYYVRVAVSGTPNGSYSDIVYRTINSVDQTKTLSAFNLTVSGTPVYSITESAVLGTYAVTYTSGLTYGGTGAYLFNFLPYPFSTSVTISKYAQTISLTSTAPTTATVGTTYTLAGTASSGLTITYTIDSSSTSICSIAGSVVTFNALGTCTINANQAGNTTYLAAPQVQQAAIATVKGAQTITFTSSAPTTAKVAGSTYTATATSTSGGAPVLTVDSSSSSICSIAAGVVSFLAVGTCKVNGNEAGGTNWNAAIQAQQSFTVAKGVSTIVITSTAPTAAVVGGSTYAMTATKTAANTNSVTYSVDSTTSTICSVSGAVVSFLLVGTCKVNANLASDTQYEAATQQQQVITVGKGDQVLAFTSSAPNAAKVGAPNYTLTATGGASTSAMVLSVDSIATGKCSVAGFVVTYLSVGDCVLNLNQAGDTNYNAATQVQQTVTITADGRCPNGFVSGNYCLIRFNTSGTWTVPTGVTTIDLLAVGGGGAGGGGAGGNTSPGGGGGGEVLEAFTQSVVTGQKFTATVGAGGIGGGAVNAATPSTSGSATTITGTNGFVTITARGGGNGATYDFTNSLAIAAGGGATIAGGGGGNGQAGTPPTTPGTGGVSTGGAGISNNTNAALQAGGGGGGAGGNGTNATSSSGGAGGAGKNSTILGMLLGGGGGGAKRQAVSGTAGTATAGGGAGGLAVAGTPGTANTGGGGGGSAGSNVGANGGSGVVVIRIALQSQTVAFTSTAPTGLVFGTSTTYTPTSSGSASEVSPVITVDASSSAVCSISAGVVSITGAGTCTLNANQAGNGFYAPASQVQQSFTVAKADQTITFTNEPASTKVNTTYTPSATATGGGSVTFTIASGSSAVCSIASGVVTFNAVGSCVVLADSAGSTNYNAAAQGSKTITVGKGDQTITFTNNPATPKVNTTYTPTATATGGGSVTFSIASNSSAICSIAGNVVTFNAVGDCVILADSISTANWSVATQGSKTVTVAKGEQTITFTNNPATPKVKTSYTPTATATGGGSVTFTIAAGSSSVCSIASGVITFLAVGDCVIKGDSAASANWNASAQGSKTVTVTKGDQAITFTSNAPTNAVVDGSTYTITANGGDSTSAVTFTVDTSATAICSISGAVVTFRAVGSCVINANQAGDVNYLPATQVQQTITVGKGTQVVGITSAAPTNAVVDGSTYAVSASNGRGTANVVLSIDSSAIAVCSITGSVVSFLAAGTCKVNANQAGDANYNAAAQVQQTFAVGRGAQVVAITSTAPSSAVVDGATYTVIKTGGRSTSSVVTSIASASASVCSISSSVVTFLTAGDCVVKVNQEGDANYTAASEATQTITVGKGAQEISITSTAPTNAVVDGSTYTVSATGGRSTSLVISSIAAASASVCSIAAGVVTFLAAGDCVVEFNQDGDANYNAAPTQTQTITVGKGSQTVDFTSLTPTGVRVDGSVYVPTATGGASTSAATISIASSSSTICEINNGEVSFHAVGSCVVEVNQAGDDNYNAAPVKTQTITVAKGLQSLTKTSVDPAAVVDGATYTPTFTSGASGSAVVVAIASGSAADCTVSNGTISFIGAGDCDVTVNQAANANYEAAPELAFTITVGKGSQAITWTTTEPSSAVVGGVTYSPAATGGATGNTVSFRVDVNTASVCAVSMGAVRFIGVGTCTVVANQSGNSNYLAAPQVSQTFTVGKGTQAIAFTSTIPTAVVDGATYTPAALGGPTGNSVTFSIASASSAVCTLAYGKISFQNVGTCEVEANQLGNTNYNAAPQVVQSFTVGKGAQTVSFTSAAPSAKVSGTTYTPVTAGGASGNAVTLSIAPASSSICSVNNGVVSYQAVGSCVVQANQAASANYEAAAQVTQTITVAKGVQVLNFTTTPPSLRPVQGTTYVPAVTFGNSGVPVVFTIGAEAASICTIANGTISFLAVGDCVLYADQAGNANYTAATRISQVFDITKGEQIVNFTSNAPTTAVVDGATYTPTGTGGAGTSPLVFSATAESAGICTVLVGVVYFQGAGDCVIALNQAGDTNYNAATQKLQTISVGKGSQTITFTSSNNTATVDGAAYLPTFTKGSSINAVHISVASSSSMVCEVTAGSVAFHSVGDCVIEATQAADNNYEAAPMVAQTISVAQGTQVALVGHASLSSLTLGSSTPTAVLTTSGGSGDGAISWSVDPTSAAYCSVSGDVVSGLASGYCDLVATKAADQNYLEATATLTVVVSTGGQAPVRTSINVENPTFSEGLTLTLSLDGGDGSGAVWFESLTTHVCNTDGGTTLNVYHAGTCNVIGHKDGDDNYEAVQDTLSFNIAKATQSGVTIHLASPLTYSATGAVTSALSLDGVLADGAQSFSVTSGTCTVVDGELSATEAGDCEVTASIVGDDKYLDGTFTHTFTIAKAAQSPLTATLATDALPAIAWNGVKTTTFDVAGGSGAGTLNVSTSTPLICSVSLTDSVVTVTGIAQGTCDASVSRAATANYLGASTLFTVEVLDLAGRPTAVAAAAPVRSPNGSLLSTVSWTAPAAASTRASVTGVKVQSRIGNGAWADVTETPVPASETSLAVAVQPWTKYNFRVAATTALDGDNLNWAYFDLSGDNTPDVLVVGGGRVVASTAKAATTSGETVIITGAGFEAGYTTRVELTTGSSVFAAGIRPAAALVQTVVLPATYISPTQLSFVLPKITLPKGTLSLTTQIKVLSTDNLKSDAFPLDYIPKKLAQTLTATLPAVNTIMTMTAPLISTGTVTSSSTDNPPVVTATPASVCTASINLLNKLVVTPVSPGKCSISVVIPGTPAYLVSATKSTVVYIKTNRTAGLTATADSVTSSGVHTPTTFNVTSGLSNTAVSVVVGENAVEVPVTLNKREGAVLFTVDAASDAAGRCIADGGDATTGLVGTITMNDLGTCKVTVTLPADDGYYVGTETIVITVNGVAADPTVPVVQDLGDGEAAPEDTDLNPKDPDTEPAVAITLDPSRAADYSFGGEDGLAFDPLTKKLNVRSRTPLVGVWTATLTSPNVNKTWFKIPGKIVKKVQTYTYSNICKLTMTVKKDPKLKKKVTRIVGAGCILSSANEVKPGKEAGWTALTSVGIQKIKVKYKRIRQYAKTGLSYVKTKGNRVLKNINRTWVVKIGRRP